MLLGNCSEWSTGRAYILCPTVTIVKSSHTVMQTVRQHQERARWTSTYKKFLEIEKLTNILTSEVDLQPSQTSMVDHPRRNSQLLKVINCFCRKAPPQMFVLALNTPPYLIWHTHYKTRASTKKKREKKKKKKVKQKLNETKNTKILT